MLPLLLYMVHSWYVSFFSLFSSTVSNLEIVKCQTKAYLTLLELGMVLHVVRDDYPSEYKYIHVSTLVYTLCILSTCLCRSCS